LDFINQFTTDIRHVSGDENVVTDALSGTEELKSSIDYSMQAKSQKTDEELKKFKQSKSGLRLEKIDFLGTGGTIFYDTSIGTPRPFLIKSFQLTEFNSIHNLTHPGIKATIKLISQRYVWPSIRMDCQNWTYMHLMSTCKNHMTCNCTISNIQKTIKKV